MTLFIIINLNFWEENLAEDIPYQTVKDSFMDMRKMKEGPYTKYIQFKCYKDGSSLIKK